MLDQEAMQIARKRLEAESLRVLVPRAGLEPARGCPRRILSPLRLPFRHLGRRFAARITVILGEGIIRGNEINR
jgi:hypothetical protein